MARETQAADQMAATLLQYYDGDCAEETKDARIQIAKRSFDLAHQQSERHAP